MLNSTNKCVLVILLLCVIASMLHLFLENRYLMHPDYCNTTNIFSQYKDRLFKITYRLNEMKRRQNALVRVLRDYQSFKRLPEKSGPSIKYEKLRNRIHLNVKELWRYLRGHIEHFGNERFMEEVANRKRSLLLDLEKIPAVDIYSKWRAVVAETTNDLVQQRLQDLQNPKDCEAQEKLICFFIPFNGFGSNIHQLAHCFALGYDIDRTVVLEPSSMQYGVEAWANNFQTLSNTCKTFNVSLYSVVDSVPDANWPDVMRVRFIGDHRAFRPLINYPLSVAKDLAYRAQKFTNDPAAWWLGQIISYFFKPKEHVLREIEKIFTKINFTAPIVGIHVRRTDKLYLEADYYEIEAYMEHVDDFYKTLELTTTVEERRVFVASDDKQVLTAARKKYPNYVFLDEIPSLGNDDRTSRDSELSLKLILNNIMILAKCSFVVCTFSSNVCRLVYELKMSRQDASYTVHSLDDLYFFWGQKLLERVAVIGHNASTVHELSFEPGDVLVVVRNNHNGYGMGSIKSKKLHDRFQFEGIFRISLESALKPRAFPWYKTDPIVKVAPFNEYTDEK